MNETVETRWQRFEQDGERKVRQNLASHVYGEDNGNMARAWLDHKVRERAEEAERRAQASSEEQLDIARSAKDAAWAAAEAAKEAATSARDAAREASAANTRTTIMLIITAISVIATIVISYLRP